MFGKSRLPIVLVVGLVIVIERSRKIDYEDYDECEDESRTCLFRRPLSRFNGTYGPMPGPSLTFDAAAFAVS